MAGLALPQRASFLLSVIDMKLIKNKIAPICSSSWTWIKKNKLKLMAFIILFIFLIIFNIFEKEHTNNCETDVENEKFYYVMCLLSIILTLSISKILSSANLFVKFLIDKYLKEDGKDRTKEEELLCYLHIFVLLLLLLFPIQYWYISYEAFHSKTDWDFFHVVLYMIVPIMFYSMSEIVHSSQKTITKESYFYSKKIIAYFIIILTMANAIIDYITLNQSTLFTNTNSIRAILLPIILFLGILKLQRLLFELIVCIIAITLFIVFVVVR